jgi:hypothetical protein
MLIAVAVRVTPVSAQGTPQAADPPPLSPQQLEQIVAPIALYPDDLLSQVLMASTYPLEVVQAARWTSQNPNMTGKALEDAMAKQTWDPSVKGLVAVPQTLAMMSEKLDWLQQLGDAFLDDQGAVLDAVQRLRKRAEGTGNLKTSPQMKVSNVSRPGPTGQPAEYIVVEPADPGVIYVPVYDPGVVYGAWPYPDYPPYYYEPPGWIPGTYAYGALAFGASVAVGAAIWGGANWWNRSVNVNVNRYNSFNRTNVASGNWNHNVNHRGNVPYRNNAAAQKFGGQSGASRARGGPGGQGLGQGAGKGQGIGQGAGKGQGLGQGAGKGQGNLGKGGGQAKGGQGAGNKMTTKGGGQGKGAHAGGSGGAKKAQGAARSGNLAKGGGGGMHRAGAGGGGGMKMGGGGGGGMNRAAMGGGMRAGGGGGGMRMGGGGGGRGGGGGGRARRSDISVKHDIAFLGRLDNGLGLYRFSYNGGDKRYVGVMAQEVQSVRPDAVTRDREGILRVDYDRLGVRFQTYDQWVGSGARVPVRVQAH